MEASARMGFGIRHASQFVRCCEGVVYQILTCGASYVGQTGRCLNIRLREDMSLRKSALPIWPHTVRSVAMRLYQMTQRCCHAIVYKNTEKL